MIYSIFLYSKFILGQDDLETDNEKFILSNKDEDTRTLLDEEIMKLGDKFEQLALDEYVYKEVSCNELDEEDSMECDTSSYLPYKGKLYYDSSHLSDKMRGLSQLYDKLIRQSEEFVKTLSDMISIWRGSGSRPYNVTWTDKRTNCSIIHCQIHLMRDSEFLDYLLVSSSDDRNQEVLLGKILDKFLFYSEQMKIWQTIRTDNLIFENSLYGTYESHIPKKDTLLLELMIKRSVIEDLEKVQEIINSYQLPENLNHFECKKKKTTENIQNLVRSLVFKTNTLFECYKKNTVLKDPVSSTLTDSKISDSSETNRLTSGSMLSNLTTFDDHNITSELFNDNYNSNFTKSSVINYTSLGELNKENELLATEDLGFINTLPTNSHEKDLSGDDASGRLTSYDPTYSFFVPLVLFVLQILSLILIVRLYFKIIKWMSKSEVHLPISMR